MLEETQSLFTVTVTSDGDQLIEFEVTANSGDLCGALMEVIRFHEKLAGGDAVSVELNKDHS